MPWPHAAVAKSSVAKRVGVLRLRADVRFADVRTSLRMTSLVNTIDLITSGFIEFVDCCVLRTAYILFQRAVFVAPAGAVQFFCFAAFRAADLGTG